MVNSSQHLIFLSRENYDKNYTPYHSHTLAKFGKESALRWLSRQNRAKGEEQGNFGDNFRFSLL